MIYLFYPDFLSQAKSIDAPFACVGSLPDGELVRLGVPALPVQRIVDRVFVIRVSWMSKLLNAIDRMVNIFRLVPLYKTSRSSNSRYPLPTPASFPLCSRA